MHPIIDVPSNVGAFAQQLADAGVKTVIRYYNHRNGPRLTSKALTKPELDALFEAGLSVAVVFQQRGGADGNLGDLSAANGRRDALRALELAASFNQPQGSAIYFAVDFDYFRRAELDQIKAYFTAVRTELATDYLSGVYGSGSVGKTLKDSGLVDHVWLAAAPRWSGTEQALREGNWTLHQKYLERESEVGGFIYDGNILNPAFPSFGQFGPAEPLTARRGEASVALFKVIARSGLNLRSGPGENFRVVQSIAAGTIVAGRGLDAGWMKVDLDGDGHVDGYMFAAFLEAVSGGLPLDLPAARRPIDVARAELALGVSEVAGPVNNPRIVMYHATTSGGAAPDETAWCSSFVNYCVEQAGLRGTDSKGARSWHDTDWGDDVAASPSEGDIVVFSRKAAGVNGGHVGFFIRDDGTTIRILGGNQGNRISIRDYPKNGTLGSFRYKLLSIRRQ
jgi:uncharacterized protein (TIGR02594 family)